MNWLNRVATYESEADFVKTVANVLESDFNIRHEARGRSLFDESQLRIDMLITPRSHLLEDNFPDAVLGIECKVIPPQYVEQISVGTTLAQCIGYSSALFVYGEVRVRPDAVLACIALDGMCIGVPNSKFASSVVLASRFNVGVLEVAKHEWKMYQSVGNIYAHRKGKKWVVSPSIRKKLFLGRKPGHRMDWIKAYPGG